MEGGTIPICSRHILFSTLCVKVIARRSYYMYVKKSYIPLKKLNCFMTTWKRKINSIPIRYSINVNLMFAVCRNTDCKYSLFKVS